MSAIAEISSDDNSKPDLYLVGEQPVQASELSNLYMALGEGLMNLYEAEVDRTIKLGNASEHDRDLWRNRGAVALESKKIANSLRDLSARPAETVKEAQIAEYQKGETGPAIARAEPEENKPISLGIVGAKASDNKLVMQIAKGKKVREIAKSDAAIGQAEQNLKGIMIRYKARTPSHLIRKIIYQNSGKLPYREHPGNDLTREQLRVLQYLSVGGRANQIAWLLEGKFSEDHAAAEQAITELKEIFEAKSEAETVYKGFLSGWLGSEDEEFVEGKEEEVQKILRRQIAFVEGSSGNRQVA